MSPCILPEAGKPTFEISNDEIEIGMGIHGEPGRRRDKVKPAQEITNELLEAINEDLKPEANEDHLGEGCSLFHPWINHPRRNE